MKKHKEKKSKIILSLAITPLLLSNQEVYSFSENLPSLYSYNNTVTNEEIELGEAWMRGFRQSGVPEWKDPIVQDYVKNMMSKLLPHSNVGNIDIKLLLLEDERLNAFSVPGGVFGVNAGLISFANKEGEFMSVMAHELAHLSQRHYKRGKDRSEETYLPTMAGILAGIALAYSGAGNAGLATAMSAQALSAQDRLSFSRKFEKEADREGVNILKSAGYHPEYMVNTFRRMMRISNLQGNNPLPFLLTHPMTENRLSDIENRIKNEDILNKEKLSTNMEYSVIYARSIFKQHSENRSYAVEKMKESEQSDDTIDYLNALFLSKDNKVKDSLETIDKLSDKYPDITSIKATGLEIALDDNQYDNAIERGEKILRLVPDYEPVKIMMVKAYIQTQPNKALHEIKKIIEDDSNNYHLYTLLEDAAIKDKNKIWIYIARSEKNQLQANFEEAIQQINFAKSLAEKKNDNQLLYIIENKIDKIEKYKTQFDNMR